MEELESDNLAYTAYHEAGHGVASCLLNIPFLYTTITPSEEDGYVGFTRFITKDNLSHQEICDDMVVLAAGIVATTFFPGGFNDNRFLAGADDDLDHIRNYAAHLAVDADEDHRYEEIQRYIDQAHMRANELLRTPAHRLAVKRVAESLLERHTLDHADVQQIIDQTSI